MPPPCWLAAAGTCAINTPMSPGTAHPPPPPPTTPPPLLPLPNLQTTPTGSCATCPAPAARSTRSLSPTLPPRTITQSGGGGAQGRGQSRPPASGWCAPALLHAFVTFLLPPHPPKQPPPHPVCLPAGGSTRGTACGAALGGSTRSWRGRCPHTPKPTACLTTRSMWWRRGWPADQRWRPGLIRPAAATDARVRGVCFLK